MKQLTVFMCLIIFLIHYFDRQDSLHFDSIINPAHYELRSVAEANIIQFSLLTLNRG